jgi:hypothetical protein
MAERSSAGRRVASPSSPKEWRGERRPHEQEESSASSAFARVFPLKGCAPAAVPSLGWWARS